MVPKGWEVIKLRDVGKCLTGLTYSPKNVVDNGLLVLRSSNVQDSKLAFEDNVYVDLDVPKEGRTKYGDILLCVRNGSRRLIGKSAFITKEAEGYVHGAFMGLFRPIDTPDYTFQLFQSESFFKQVNQNLGATINSINSGNLYDFKFPYPPIQEREKIANILSTWDNAIRTTERLIDNSTQQKKALMQQLLTGKKRLLDDEGKRFSDKWKKVELGKLLDYKQPTPYLVKSTDYSDEYITPVLTAGKTFILGYTDEKFGIFREELPVIIFDDFTTASKFVNFPFKAKSSAMKMLTAKDGVSIKYVFEAMQFLNFAVGGHQRHWISIFANLAIPLPSLKEQQEIATVLTNADKEIELLEQQLADLQQEKKALMQVLLTGKKRVLVHGEVV